VKVTTRCFKTLAAAKTKTKKLKSNYEYGQLQKEELPKNNEAC